MDRPRIIGDTMIVPSDQEYLADIDAFLEATLRGFGVDESIIADIAISVSELVNNAMLHGNKSAADKSVTIKLLRENSSVKITISDQGAGFDPDSIEDPLAEENLMKEIGRGIFIVRSLMDSVDIEAATTGTTVTIAKAF
ncbi:MAG: ATP-binding protein [Candidatus Zixiibacteriota bacterium]|nr:MAG: ATP-binding protein [candidate division Zixibacteria bacterium]